jgi:hypothetical protein
MRACGHAQMVKRTSGSPVASAAQVPAYLGGTTEPALWTEVCSGVNGGHEMDALGRP